MTSLTPVIDRELVSRLAGWSERDARVALTTLEEAVLATPPSDDGTRLVAESSLFEALGQAGFAYDCQGEDHYILVSALVNEYAGSAVYI